MGESLAQVRHRQPERTKGTVHSLAPNFSHGTKREKMTKQTKAITPELEGMTGRKPSGSQKPFSALGIEEVPVEVAGGGVGRGRI